jgi:hypothetical protein
LLAETEFLCTSNEVLLDSAPAAAAVEPPAPPSAEPVALVPPLAEMDAVTAPVLLAEEVCDTLALFDWSAEMEMLWLRKPPETPAISASVSWMRSFIVSILHLRFGNRERCFLS